MFKKLMALTLVCLMMVTMLAGCKAKLVGEWECDGVTMTLNKDGTGEMDLGIAKAELEWEAKNGELTIEINGEKETMEYEIKGKTLIIDDEEWTKK
ncbi:MAG: hypothetical protein IJB36_01805 [Clostridia bacterium]|nr:hypothetical protein [Clostridia bacterium]